MLGETSKQLALLRENEPNLPAFLATILEGGKLPNSWTVSPSIWSKRNTAW